MLIVQAGGSLFSMKISGCASLFPPGAGLNGEVNGVAGETLRGEERLIGFVVHLSTEEEEDGRDGTPQVES